MNVIGYTYAFCTTGTAVFDAIGGVASVNKDYKQLKKDITLTDIDENIISVDGDKITTKAKGETYVTARWQNFSVALSRHARLKVAYEHSINLKLR